MLAPFSTFRPGHTSLSSASLGWLTTLTLFREILTTKNVWFQSKDWIKALPALRRALECPVCLEVLKASVSACRNVHVTCSSCRSKLTKCSLCQQPFMQEKPTFVNSLLEVLPRGCRYADDGCKQVFVSRGEHEDFCEFRAISCRARGCSERVKLNQM